MQLSGSSGYDPIIKHYYPIRCKPRRGFPEPLTGNETGHVWFTVITVVA